MTAHTHSRRSAIGRPIAPFRAYRTLARSFAGSATALVTAALCTIVIAIEANPLVHLLTTVDTTALRWTGVSVAMGSDRYLWTNPTPLLFSMPPHPWPQLATVIACCLVAIVLLSTLLRHIEAPLRYFINFNLLIVGAEAAYLLLAGHLGYSAASFSTLLLRTTITTWLLVPLVVGIITTLFPFTPLESASLVITCAVYELVLSFARYAAFVGILTHTGPLLMPAMYLLYGPLLDILPIIGIYSLFMSRLAHRIARTPEAWEWL